MAYPTHTPIARYIDFSPSTWVIPKMYWDAFSSEQRYHALCRQLCKLIAYADQLGIDSNHLTELYETLASDFDSFKKHGFDDYYKEQVEYWIKNNLDYIFDETVKQVYFGLTLDGHFVAYIPESWDDIVFDTGAIYGEDTYGRLILRWDVDNSGESVNQRPEDWS